MGVQLNTTVDAALNSRLEALATRRHSSVTQLARVAYTALCPIPEAVTLTSNGKSIECFAQISEMPSGWGACWFGVIDSTVEDLEQLGCRQFPEITLATEDGRTGTIMITEAVYDFDLQSLDGGRELRKGTATFVGTTPRLGGA